MRQSTALLDRNQESNVDESTESEGLNQYFNSFKVASYVTKNQEIKPDEVKSTNQVASVYWERLLRNDYEKQKEVSFNDLGKGKRVRKPVNYKSYGQNHDDAEPERSFFKGGKEGESKVEDEVMSDHSQYNSPIESESDKSENDANSSDDYDDTGKVKKKPSKKKSSSSQQSQSQSTAAAAAAAINKKRNSTNSQSSQSVASSSNQSKKSRKPATATTTKTKKSKTLEPLATHDINQMCPSPLPYILMSDDEEPTTT